MIWVDADAYPQAIKQILVKAAQKRKVTITFVANHYIALPKSSFLHFRQVEQGFDVADHVIATSIKPDDLLISQDIPLADEAITKGAQVINTKGDTIDKESIKQRLNIRDFNETMRFSGIQSKGPSPFSDKDKQRFANAFDQYCQKVCKKPQL